MQKNMQLMSAFICHEKESHNFKPKIKESGDIKKQQSQTFILGNGKTPDKLRISMWNVNGIRSVFSKNVMNPYLYKYNPDLFCINQTKINKEQFDKSPIYIKGYNGYWNFCKCSAGYSGVVIFSKYLPISVFEDLEEAQFSQEGRVITLQFQYFYVVAVYIPSAGGKQLERLLYKTKMYEVAFHGYCQKLRKKGKAVIVCGDMNVCHEEIDIHMTPNAHKTPGFTDVERKSFKHFLNKGWIDTFRKLNPNDRKYTWWRIEHGNRERNIGKRLDYCLINEEFIQIVTSSNVVSEVKGSDHCPVDMTIDLCKIKKQKNKTTEVQQKNNDPNQNLLPITTLQNDKEETVQSQQRQVQDMSQQNISPKDMEQQNILSKDSLTQSQLPQSLLQKNQISNHQNQDAIITQLNHCQHQVNPQEDSKNTPAKQDNSTGIQQQ